MWFVIAWSHAEQKQDERKGGGKREGGKKKKTHIRAYIKKNKNKITLGPESLDCCNLESGYVKI